MKTTLALATTMATLALGAWSGSAADACVQPQAGPLPPRAAAACLGPNGDATPAALPAIDVLVTGTKPNTVASVPGSRPNDLAARPMSAGH